MKPEPPVLAAQVERARASLLAGNPRVAIALLEPLAAQDSAALEGLVRAWMLEGRPDRARAALRPVLGRPGSSSLLWALMGLAQLSLGQGPQGERALRRALRLDPSSSAALHGLATLALHGADPSSARRYWMRLLEAPPSPASSSGWPDLPGECPTPAEIHAGLGLALVREGRDGDAVDHLERALAQGPQTGALEIALAGALGRSGRRPEALAMLRARRIDHRADLDVALELATLCASLRDRTEESREEAITVLDEVLRDPPSGADARKVARAWFLLASLYDDSPERYPQAIEAYQKGLVLDPGFAPALNALGALLLESGDSAGAGEALVRALQAAPDHPHAQRNLAKWLMGVAGPARALEAFETVAAPGGRRAGHALFGVTQAMVDLAAIRTYEDLYSQGHQIKNRVGLAASEIKRLLRRSRESQQDQDPTSQPTDQVWTGRLERVLADHQETYQMLVGFLGALRPKDLERVAVDPVRLVRDVAASFGRPRLVRVGSVRSRTTIGHRTTVPLLDRKRIAQALENLVGNAIEAVSERHGDQTDRKGRVRLLVDLVTDPDHLRVVVEDNGAGIPTELRQEVFRAGFTTKPSGNGLGLALARRAAAEHGGRLELDETPEGGGTRFVLRLPLDAGARQGVSDRWTRPFDGQDPGALHVDELA